MESTDIRPKSVLNMSIPPEMEDHGSFFTRLDYG